MKKSYQYTQSNKDLDVKSDLEIDKIKTTNINVLLNRVRLDKKRALKKRIIFSSILTGMTCLLAAYFII